MEEGRCMRWEQVAADLKGRIVVIGMTTGRRPDVAVSLTENDKVCARDCWALNQG